MSDLGNREIMAFNINRLLDERNVSRRKVCEDLGIAYSTFSDWCDGNSYPRIDKIERMADYFGVRKSDLVEREKHVRTDEEELLLSKWREADDSIKSAIRKLLDMPSQKDAELSSFTA